MPIPLPHLARFPTKRIRRGGRADRGTGPLSRLVRHLFCRPTVPTRSPNFGDHHLRPPFWPSPRRPPIYTLLEVGLGGRLDATNVIDRPALTVITPVDMDHQQFLGDTLARIAAEKKAGIKSKRGAVPRHHRAAQQDEALEGDRGTGRPPGAPVLAHGQHWHGLGGTRAGWCFQDETGLLDLPPNPPFWGAHQVEKAGIALAALRKPRPKPRPPVSRPGTKGHMARPDAAPAPRPPGLTGRRAPEGPSGGASTAAITPASRPAPSRRFWPRCPEDGPRI